MPMNTTAIGNLAADPTIFEADGDKPKCARVRYISNPTRKKDNRPGTAVEARFYGIQADLVEKNFRKGSGFCARGELVEETYQHNGVERTKLVLDDAKMQFLPGGPKSGDVPF